MNLDFRLQNLPKLNDIVRFNPIDPDIYSYPVPSIDTKVQVLQIVPQYALLQTLGIVLNMCLVQDLDSKKTFYLYEDDLLQIC
jgi:hypothetical protein